MGILRQLFSATTDDRTARPNQYECQNCHELFEFQFHVCPDCGSFSIERDDWGLPEH